MNKSLAIAITITTISLGILIYSELASSAGFDSFERQSRQFEIRNIDPAPGLGYRTRSSRRNISGGKDYFDDEGIAGRSRRNIRGGYDYTPRRR